MEDERDAQELDQAVRELLPIAQDETLSPLARVKLWSAIRELSEEKSAVLGLDLG